MLKSEVIPARDFPALGSRFRISVGLSINQNVRGFEAFFVLVCRWGVPDIQHFFKFFKAPYIEFYGLMLNRHRSDIASHKKNLLVLQGDIVPMP